MCRYQVKMKMVFREFKLICFITLAIDLLGGSYISEGLPIPTVTEPCRVDDSFIFTREDAMPGSVVMELPTYNGEEWRLTETDLDGYLVLDTSHDHHTLLVFARSPDVEYISETLGRRKESLPFILECTYDGWLYKYKQELIIDDVNDHHPVFDAERSYNISISESTGVGSNIFSLRNLATDPDITGKISQYSLTPHQDTGKDGRQYFALSDDGSHVILSQPIDFDQLNVQGQTQFKLNITAVDNGKPRALSSSVTLTIHVLDSDDQGPAFVYPNCQMTDNFCALPYFQSVIKCGYKGPLRLYPAPILAIDRDTQNNSILYEITRVEPAKFMDKFEMDNTTGEIHVIKPSCAPNIKEILITITAKEISPLGHKISTTLQIELLDSLVVPNMAWNPETGGPLVQDTVGGDFTPTTSSLPLTLFILAIVAFIIIGSVVAFVMVRVSKNRKKKRKAQETANNILNAYSYKEECGDCQLCKNDLNSSISCFRTCPLNHHNLSTNSSINSESSQSPLTPYDRATYEMSGETDSLPPPTSELEPSPEMKTTFGSPSRRGSRAVSFTDSVRFSPKPAMPGQADSTGFYDTFTSFGTLKPKRRGGNKVEDDEVRSHGSLRQVGRFKLRFTSVVPELFKTNTNSRVRFDTGIANHSSV